MNRSPVRGLLVGLAVAAAAVAAADAVPDAATADARIVADAPGAAQRIAEGLRSAGYKTDFSLESLKEIDRLADEAAPNGVAVPGGFLSADPAARIFSLGCYVGEVLRRAVGGGEWRGNDLDPQAAVDVELHLKSGPVVQPVKAVVKRLKNGSQDSLYTFGRATLNR